MLPYNTSVKHDFIEDLNQSPREQIFIPNPEMINPNTVSNQNKYFSNNILEKNTNELNSMKNKQDIINFNPQEFENQKLQDVIKVLEQKIVDLQKQFQEIEVKSYEETPLILQIKEKVFF